VGCAAAVSWPSPTPRKIGLTLPVFDITTGTGDFIADGVVSHKCFTRDTTPISTSTPAHDLDTQIVVD
jgi:hypothetical protein